MQFSVDFEDCIHPHTVRKLEPSRNNVYSENCVPLLIRDVHKIQYEARQPKSVFGIRFRTCMIYGQLIECKSKPGKMIYLVDDGTGVIPVYYTLKREDPAFDTIIDSINAQIVNARKHGLPQFGLSYSNPCNTECTKLCNSMELLVRKIKKLTYSPSESSGHRRKVYVTGKPNVGQNGESYIWAEDISIDDSDDRTSEIIFKTHLANIYAEVYRKQVIAPH